MPQGAVLSPVLYTVYNYDLPVPNDMKIEQYADDTANHTTSRFAKQIQKRLIKGNKKVQKYFTKWKIRTNAAKYKAIFFTKRKTKQIPTTPLNIDSHDTPWSTSVKHLGLIMDKKLTYKNHIDYVITKTLKVQRMYYSLLSRRSRLSLDNKILLYKTAIRPIFSYAAPIIHKAAPTHIKKLQTLQNKILRQITGVIFDPTTLRYSATTDEVHQITGIEPVSEFFNELTAKFEARIEQLLN